MREKSYIKTINNRKQVRENEQFNEKLRTKEKGKEVHTCARNTKSKEYINLMSTITQTTLKREERNGKTPKTNNDQLQEI